MSGSENLFLKYKIEVSDKLLPQLEKQFQLLQNLQKRSTDTYTGIDKDISKVCREMAQNIRLTERYAKELDNVGKASELLYKQRARETEEIHKKIGKHSLLPISATNIHYLTYAWHGMAEIYGIKKLYEIQKALTEKGEEYNKNLIQMGSMMHGNNIEAKKLLDYTEKQAQTTPVKTDLMIQSAMQISRLGNATVQQKEEWLQQIMKVSMASAGQLNPVDIATVLGRMADIGTGVSMRQLRKVFGTSGLSSELQKVIAEQYKGDALKNKQSHILTVDLLEAMRRYLLHPDVKENAMTYSKLWSSSMIKLDNSMNALEKTLGEGIIRWKDSNAELVEKLNHLTISINDYLHEHPQALDRILGTGIQGAGELLPYTVLKMLGRVSGFFSKSRIATGLAKGIAGVGLIEWHVGASILNSILNSVNDYKNKNISLIDNFTNTMSRFISALTFNTVNPPTITDKEVGNANTPSDAVFRLINRMGFATPEQSNTVANYIGSFLQKGYGALQNVYETGKQYGDPLNINIAINQDKDGNLNATSDSSSKNTKVNTTVNKGGNQKLFNKR